MNEIICTFCELLEKYFFFVFLGQLYQIAKELYETSLDIRVLETSTNIPGSRSVKVTFRIDFDNREYVSISEKRFFLNKYNKKDTRKKIF